MSRYIDADALKERLMQNITLTNAIDKSFSEEPSIDIVRCKECKHYKILEAVYDCEMGLTNVAISDFCSYGERRASR